MGEVKFHPGSTDTLACIYYILTGKRFPFLNSENLGEGPKG